MIRTRTADPRRSVAKALPRKRSPGSGRKRFSRRRRKRSSGSGRWKVLQYGVRTITLERIPDVVLRPAGADDVERVLEFWKHAGDELDRPNDTQAAVLALLDYDPGAMILAVDDDEVVGSVVLGWDGWRGHVYRLAVHPSYRRAGLGTTLLETAEQRARDHGCVRIDAIVFDENARAQGLWATAGYRRQSRWSRWVKQL